LYQQFTKPPNPHRYFEKPRFSNSAFTIVHYAHPVVYETEGFLEKNRDTVPDELLAMLQQSEFEFCRQLFANFAPLLADEQQSSGRPTKRPQKPTLGSEFKRSLASLMATVRQTNVHYIRCIKPNEGKRAFHFNRLNVMKQLRACGVLETIRISCAGMLFVYLYFHR
jgi:myosin-5